MGWAVPPLRVKAENQPGPFCSLVDAGVLGICLWTSVSFQPCLCPHFLRWYFSVSLGPLLLQGQLPLDGGLPSPVCPQLNSMIPTLTLVPNKGTLQGLGGCVVGLPCLHGVRFGPGAGTLNLLIARGPPCLPDGHSPLGVLAAR